jgi:hypothetical protein
MRNVWEKVLCRFQSPSPREGPSEGRRVTGRNTVRYRLGRPLGAVNSQPFTLHNMDRIRPFNSHHSLQLRPSVDGYIGIQHGTVHTRPPPLLVLPRRSLHARVQLECTMPLACLYAAVAWDGLVLESLFLYMDRYRRSDIEVYWRSSLLIFFPIHGFDGLRERGRVHHLKVVGQGEDTLFMDD